MDHREVGRYWNENAEAWTRLSRAGYDVYRDGLNTPAFFALLPEVTGLRGLDVGCGEGHNTRLLADRGARVVALDLADVFLRQAREHGRLEPRAIDYLQASALELPFRDAAFDFVVGFMSFMDVPGPERVLAEAHRVLRPGGFLQFSIEHPCFAQPHRRNLRGPDGRTYAFELGRYFERQDGRLTAWTFGAAPPEAREGLPPFVIPAFTRPIGDWLNMLIDAGFRIERVAEPTPDEETVRRYPRLQDAQVIAYFLHLRARKPLP
ncbi:MAG: methyltransferase domain-containing protein [Vicinamibacterales bacterium]|jgi:SAM-dependent methyltransferase|nr:methyltransferase domain-containing protein [Vicinamibacterales bacterium]